MTPQKMLETLLSPHYEGGGRLANDFADELGRTIPLENLRLLLLSDNAATRGTGAFISTIMGSDRNLNFMIETLAALLDDPCPQVRFDVIESIRYFAEEKDGHVLGRILLHLDDPDQLVRYGVMKAIQILEQEALLIAKDHAATLRPNSAFSEIAEMYSYGEVSPRVLRDMLGHPDPVLRRFGFGLAGRPRHVVVDRYVEWAEGSPDAEISALATQLLKRSGPRPHTTWHSSLPPSRNRARQTVISARSSSTQGS